VLYLKKLERPHDCIVNNDGIVCCEDWGKRNAKIYSIIVFDTNGFELNKQKHKLGLYSNLTFDDTKRQIMYLTTDHRQHTLDF
jgi:hypothetical protein